MRTDADRCVLCGTTVGTFSAPRHPGRHLEAGQWVLAPKNGYLQIVDYDRSLSLACEHDWAMEVRFRPGHFIVQGRALASLVPGARVDDALIEIVHKAFVLGHEPTPTQDPEFATRQLVEIALRALSPGINDSFTAMSCIDWLGAALCRLTQREIPSPYRYDDQRQVRLVIPVVGFSGMADAAFHQIRQAARTNSAVTIRLLETISTVAAQARRAEDRRVLGHHGLLVWRSSQAALPDASDRQDAENRYRELQRVLAGGERLAS